MMRRKVNIEKSPTTFLDIAIDPITNTVGGVKPGLLAGFVTDSRVFNQVDADAEGILAGKHTLLRWDAFVFNSSFSEIFQIDIYLKNPDGSYYLDPITGKKVVNTNLLTFEEDEGWELKNASEVELVSQSGRVVQQSAKVHFCFCQTDQLTVGYPEVVDDNKIVLSPRWGDWYDNQTTGQRFIMDNVPKGNYLFRWILDPDSLVGQYMKVEFMGKWDGKTFTPLVKE